jgi:hypothetical protein
MLFFSDLMLGSQAAAPVRFGLGTTTCTKQKAARAAGDVSPQAQAPLQWKELAGNATCSSLCKLEASHSAVEYQTRSDEQLVDSQLQALPKIPPFMHNTAVTLLARRTAPVLADNAVFTGLGARHTKESTSG